MSADWSHTRLGEVALVEMGQSPPSVHVYERGIGGMAFLQGNAEFTGLYPRPRLVCRKPLKTAQQGDTLISVRAPVGAINRADQAYCIGRGLAAIRFRGADADFGYQALTLSARALRRVSQGTTFEAVGGLELRGLDFPLPPLPEQRRIGEILNTLDKAIRKTEQVVAKLQQMKRGLLHDLLTHGINENGELRDPEMHPEQFIDSELGRIPKCWDVTEFGKASWIIDPNPSHRYPGEVDEGVPIVSTENFRGEDSFDTTSAKRVPWAVFHQQQARCNYNDEDVVFARKGRIGFSRSYGIDRKVFSHTIVIMKPRGGTISRFLLWLSRSHVFMNGIRKRMNSNSGVPTLGVDFLGKVQVPLPSVSEQRQIAAMMDAFHVRVKDEETELVKLLALKQGLMDDLLAGRVRVATRDEDKEE
jgi:type I restriction enzyme S subunit